MREFKENIKKYMLVKYAESKLKECNNRISRTVPWIRRKSLSETIETHCRVLLNTLLNSSEKQSFRENKYILDSILKYTLNRSETLLKSNKKAKDIQSYMQLSSYIVFDEIAKGLSSRQSKKTIKYNIEKHLSEIQENIDSKANPTELIEELCK